MKLLFIFVATVASIDVKIRTSFVCDAKCQHDIDQKLPRIIALAERSAIRDNDHERVLLSRQTRSHGTNLCIKSELK